MRRGMVYGVAARAIAERELLGGNLVSPSNHRTKLSAFARVGWASNQCVLRAVRAVSRSQQNAAMARTAVVPDATPVGALSAPLRRFAVRSRSTA